MGMNDILTAIDSELSRLKQAQSLLAGISTDGRRATTVTTFAEPRCKVSGAARKRMAAAQRKRWAGLKAGEK